jgi:hypothetical protein
MRPGILEPDPVVGILGIDADGAVVWAQQLAT